MTLQKKSRRAAVVVCLLAMPCIAQVPMTSVTDAKLQNPDAQDWLMFRRTLNGWGYSPLEQITTKNVPLLRLVWSRAMKEGMNEATPLVHEGVMYLPNPGNVIQALDATSGDLLWQYKRDLPAELKTLMSVPSVNRNIAVYLDMVIASSADDFVYALEARTGKLRWETQVHDWRTMPAMQTSGPIVANGKLISGRNCLPKGGADACVITGHDARSGKELWRTRTIPRTGEPGDETWGSVPQQNRRHIGTWMPATFDPELNLLYIGTSGTSPAAKFVLGGNANKHLYDSSTLALDPDTGSVRWYYQHVTDHWDMDHTYQRLLVDTTVTPAKNSVRWINPKLRAGERRKVVTGIPGKIGIVYTLDRKTGEFLWATPTVHQTMVESIDGASGEVTVNPEMLFHKIGDEIHACPGSTGGMNWNAGAYDPELQLMFYPLQNTCMSITATSDTVNDQSLYGNARVHVLADGTDNLGSVWAISATTGKVAWKYEQRAAVNSLVSTGGGVLFGGDENGRFRAFDQSTGKVLWETNLGAPVTGFPISFAVGGAQFVAVSTGGTSVLSVLHREMTPELAPEPSNRVFVFALPDAVGTRVTQQTHLRAPADLPRVRTRAQEAASGGAAQTRSIYSGIYADTQARRGKELLNAHCQSCHGASNGAVVALSGPTFMATYHRRSLRELFTLIKTRMPAGNPGSLRDQDYIDIVAAILHANGVPPGTSEVLKPDESVLEGIRFTQRPSNSN